MLLAVVAACAGETVEVPGETVVVKEEVIKTVEVPGETVVKEVIKEVQVPGETVVVKEEVVKEVMVPGETVVVEKVVTETVEVPGETVTVEVVKTVEVPGETVVVEKEVVKTVEVPGQTVVVEKEVVKTVEVPGETVVVKEEVVKTVEVPGPERVVVKEVPAGYVTDPTTGKAVTAPQYGGTVNLAQQSWFMDNWDHYYGYVRHTAGVLEKLGMRNWGLDRDEYDFQGPTPVSALTGMLAESWDISADGLTYTFNIRKGVNWHDKAPLNGRELTADDIVYTFQRLTGLGKFSNAEPSPMLQWADPRFESITASGKSTVVFKLTQPNLDMLATLLNDYMTQILPGELIEESRTVEVPQGKFSDGMNLVGTGPYEVTDFVVGSSFQYTKNPDYWGYDEKYPENRLPYIDEIKTLIMPDMATLLAAMRTGKVDYIGWPAASSVISNIDDVDSLRRSRPEIQLWPIKFRNLNAWAMDVRQPPFDDIRVRHAMQMALDRETMNRTLFKGLGDNTPYGVSAVNGYIIPFEEWPEELKKTYNYDPEGAEALLDAAGYSRGADGIRFNTKVNLADWFDATYVEAASSYWREIGVEVEINMVDSVTSNAMGREHTFEGLKMANTAAQFPPTMTVNWAHSTDNFGQNGPGWQDPELDDMVEAAVAAKTIEEQRRLIIEVDMYQIENRGFVFGTLVPIYFANWPWLKGYNGEIGGGNPGELGELFGRLWLDLDLKAAMGY